MRTIDKGATVFTAAEIRVALLPVGNVPAEVLRDYCQLIERYRHVDLPAVKSFYHEKQKSPLKYLPWAEGALHFRFVQEREALEPTPLAHLHACRSVLGVIGLCHCPNSPDISAAYAKFEEMAKQFPDAVALRCFAFDPLRDEQQDSKKNEHLIMFPPGDRNHIEQHVEVLMHDFAACVLMELQQKMLNAGISSMSLSTPIDEKSFSGILGITDDVSKKLGSEEEVKQRRKHTRLEKLLGDWCLLGGSPQDALEHFTQCMELAKLSGDVVWSAAALEGIAEAKVIEALVAADSIPGARIPDASSPPDSPGSEVGSPTSRALRFESTLGFGGVTLWNAIKKSRTLENQVRSLYAEAGNVYQRRGIVPLQIEVELKRVRFAAGLHGKGAKSEVCDILTQVMDQWPLLKSEEDKVSVVVEAAQVLGLVGSVRKRALLVWQALEAARNLQRSDVLLLDVALKSLDPPGDHENQDTGEFRRVNWGLANCALPNRSWYLLNRAMLEALLPTASRAGSQVYVWEAAATLLREHCGALSLENQQVLIDALSKASAALDGSSRIRPGPGPPPIFQVRNISGLKEELKPVTVDPGAKQETGPFIFNPLLKKRAQEKQGEENIQWVVGEECSLEVYIANPCEVQMKVERLSLNVEMVGGSEGKVAQKIPVAVVLPPKTKPTRVSLALVPLVPGKMRILGVNVTLYGVTWLQRFTPTLRRLPLAEGVSLVDAPWGHQEKNMVVTVDILPALPLLKAKFLSKVEEGITSPCSSPHSSNAKEEPKSEKKTTSMVLVREGEKIKCVMNLYNASKIPVTTTMLDCKQVGKGGRPKGVALKFDEKELNEKLPIAPKTSIDVPTWIDAGLCVHSENEESTPDIDREVRLKYRGSASQASGGEGPPLGRETKINLRLRHLPSVKMTGISITDQYIPCKPSTASDAAEKNDAHASNHEPTKKNGFLNKGRGSKNGSGDGAAKSRSGNGSDEVGCVEPPSTSGCTCLARQCLLQVDAVNQMKDPVDVWLRAGDGGVDAGVRWEAPGGASLAVQSDNTAHLSCIVPPMEPQSNEEVNPSLDLGVAEWICSRVNILWQAGPSPETNIGTERATSEPGLTQLDLHSSTGIHGVIPLVPAEVRQFLSPRVLGILARNLVTVSVALVVDSTKEFVDIASSLTPQVPGKGSTNGEWVANSRDVLQDSCFEDVRQSGWDGGSLDVVSTLDIGPRGPNGEIWGVESCVGEIVECELVIENGGEEDVQLCMTVCTEALDSNLGKGSSSDQGILILGVVGKLQVEVKKTSVERHRFSICPVSTGVFEVFACEDVDVRMDGNAKNVSSVVQGTRLNLLCK
ncbi:hypothetical protein BSKO_00199 [Bryopsis sp. KO-2023]|nr:hypothetical protein BSKO_00199 [Bryopsis sp. KO-2023]